MSSFLAVSLLVLFYCKYVTYVSAHVCIVAYGAIVTIDMRWSLAPLTCCVRTYVCAPVLCARVYMCVSVSIHCYL